MIAAILIAIVCTALLWFGFTGLYWLILDRQREKHEDRHHDDLIWPRGGSV